VRARSVSRVEEDPDGFAPGVDLGPFGVDQACSCRGVMMSRRWQRWHQTVPLRQRRLNPTEDPLGDKGFVPSVGLDALVCNDSEVVAIPEHEPELVRIPAGLRFVGCSFRWNRARRPRVPTVRVRDRGLGSRLTAFEVSRTLRYPMGALLTEPPRRRACTDSFRPHEARRATPLLVA
jgi:hypothetical protein